MMMEKTRRDRRPIYPNAPLILFDGSEEKTINVCNMFGIDSIIRWLFKCKRMVINKYLKVSES